jgi:hypothetical protein
LTSADKTKLDSIAAGAQVNVATNLGYTTAASAGSVTSSTGANAALPAATPSVAGLLTSADKTKLDSIAAGAQVNVGTNLGISGTGNTRTITSSTGSNVTVPVATASNAGLMATGDKTKLDGIAASTAELNILDGATATTAQLNFVTGVTSAIQTQLNTKAPLASPTFTGTPTAPTQTAGNNSTQLATTAFVTTANNLKANLASPTFTGTVNATTVDTTNLEVTNIKAKDGTASATIANSTGVLTVASSVLTTTDINGGTITGITDLAVADGGTGASTAAAALTNLGLTATAAELNKLDGATATTAQLNFVTGVTSAIQTQLNTKANLVSPTFIGIPIAPTAVGGSNTTQIATTAFVTTANNLKANLATPTFTGTPTAPTQTAGNNSTRLATTAYTRTAIPDVLNASGSAPIYACRAWVNFDGTGTVSIRGSGNVSSITDNGTGNYTVNFATAMQDANFCATLAYTNEVNVQHTLGFISSMGSGFVSFEHYSATHSNNKADKSQVHVAIFR